MTNKQYNAFKDWLSGKDPHYIIKLQNKSTKLKIRFEMRSKDNFMGRFGGGWQWKVGFQASETTIIIYHCKMKNNKKKEILTKNDEVIFDFGEHIVGHISFDLGYCELFLDSPVL